MKEICIRSRRPGFEIWNYRIVQVARRCPRCGSYKWVYKGDRQICADCGK
jgi:ribosomal protein S27AE